MPLSITLEMQRRAASCIIVLELTLTFSPADGSAPRVITARIENPERAEEAWSALAVVSGFEQTWSQRIYGVDWPQAVELAAQIIPVYLEVLVANAGGGTLDPPIAPREKAQSPKG
jgi:hypothetical protein